MKIHQIPKPIKMDVLNIYADKLTTEEDGLHLDFKCYTDTLIPFEFYNAEFDFVNPFSKTVSYYSEIKDILWTLWKRDVIVEFISTHNSEDNRKIEIGRFVSGIGKITLRYEELFNADSNHFSYKAYLNDCGQFIIQ